jgi:hypothetical protein
MSEGIVKKVLLPSSAGASEATRQSVVSMMLKLSALGMLAGTVHASTGQFPVNQNTSVREVQSVQRSVQLSPSVMAVLRESPSSGTSNNQCGGYSACSGDCPANHTS